MDQADQIDEDDQEDEDELEYRPPQFRTLMILEGVCAVFVVIGIVGGAIGGNAAALVALGVVAVFMGIIVGHFAAARTALSPSGIRTGWLIVRHSCDWPDVAAIDTRVRSGRTTITDILITRSSGRKFKLAAPTDGLTGKDREFSAKLEEIRDYRAQHRTQP